MSRIQWGSEAAADLRGRLGRGSQALREIHQQLRALEGDMACALGQQQDFSSRYRAALARLDGAADRLHSLAAAIAQADRILCDCEKRLIGGAQHECATHGVPALIRKGLLPPPLDARFVNPNAYDERFGRVPASLPPLTLQRLRVPLPPPGSVAWDEMLLDGKD